MKSAGAALRVLSAAVVCLLAVAHPAAGHEREGKRHARVITDGRLRPGHLETIWLKDFAGKGGTEVSFFPTAICEEECSAWTFRGGRTDAKGAAKFRIHVPQTFLDAHNHRVYFRNRERINVLVAWEGPGESFDLATAEPEPIIVRVHGSHHHG